MYLFVPGLTLFTASAIYIFRVGCLEPPYHTWFYSHSLTLEHALTFLTLFLVWVWAIWPYHSDRFSIWDPRSKTHACYWVYLLIWLCGLPAYVEFVIFRTLSIYCDALYDVFNYKKFRNFTSQTVLMHRGSFFAYSLRRCQKWTLFRWCLLKEMYVSDIPIGL